LTVLPPSSGFEFAFPLLPPQDYKHPPIRSMNLPFFRCGGLELFFFLPKQGPFRVLPSPPTKTRALSYFPVMRRSLPRGQLFSRPNCGDDGVFVPLFLLLPNRRSFFCVFEFASSPRFFYSESRPSSLPSAKMLSPP